MPQDSQEQPCEERFRTSTIEFETRCNEMKHRLCVRCHSVSLQFQTSSELIESQFTCQECKKSNNWTAFGNSMLPVWYDEHGHVQYHVPSELSSLREGEKLLIQQVAVYVPLQHLMYGQVGARGHIVSFPQNISSVCKTLPRLPDGVTVIRVIKRFKLSDGEISSKSFSIRKRVVLEALWWLKRFNRQYSDIDICEDNLNWITNGDEQELPMPCCEEPIDPKTSVEAENEDLGPSPEQIADQLQHADDPIEPCYGVSSEFNSNKPKQKDKTVIEALKKAEMQGRMLSIDDDGTAIHFPYVSPEPVCEYTETYLFEYAFPWLFPGGTGGYMSGPNPKPKLREWLRKMAMYKDCRFDHDRLWAFFALNYMTRHNNQGSGNFFVKSFFENGPKNLEQLQEHISAGKLEWLDRITYFSQCVPGSSAYWRSKRREVFAWINYHVEKGNGVPTFFITLSCAEYHWRDIERLVQDRCVVAGIEPPDFTKGKFKTQI
jgi:hypothetical protein